MSLKKKLSKLKINESDIEIILEGDFTQDELEKKFNKLNNPPKKEDKEDDIKIYIFKNDNGEVIKSLFDNLDDLSQIINTRDFRLVE